MASPNATERTGFQRWSKRIFLAVLVVALVAVGKWAHWRYVLHRFRVITPGEVYQSAEMPMDDLLATIRERGIKTVVDFREEPLDAIELERKTLEEAGVRYVNLPTPQVPAEGTVEKYLDLIQQEDTLPMLVHCEHGEGRSVLFAALYRVEMEGWDPEEARKATRLFSWRGSFAPGTGKGDFLRNYQRHLPAPGAGEAALPAGSR